MSDEYVVSCETCKGRGSYADHAPHPHPDGDCCGECPIQVQCETCLGTGRSPLSETKKSLTLKHGDSVEVVCGDWTDAVFMCMNGDFYVCYLPDDNEYIGVRRFEIREAVVF